MRAWEGNVSPACKDLATTEDCVCQEQREREEEKHNRLHVDDSEQRSKDD